MSAMNERAGYLRRRIKRGWTLVGVAATGILVAVGVCHQGTVATNSTLAGSGDAPTNTVYIQPAVSGMNVGATATWSAPPAAPATSVAAPALKGGK